MSKTSNGTLYAVLAALIVAVLGYLYYKAHTGNAAAIAQLQAGVAAAPGSVSLYTPSMGSVLLPSPNAPL